MIIGETSSFQRLCGIYRMVFRDKAKKPDYHLIKISS